MSLLLVILILFAIGVGMYFFNTLPIPIDARFKQLINWVVIIAVVLWLLNLFGIFALFGAVKFPTLK
jgi:hypothetical protein